MMTQSNPIPAALTLALLTLCLTGCELWPTRQEPAAMSLRTLQQATNTPLVAPTQRLEKPVLKPSNDQGKLSPAKVAEGLKLARLLRDQGRFQAASEVYAQLDQHQSLQPLELLEYATVAANVQSPQESLATFGRVRRQFNARGSALPQAANLALCTGLARARLALGQTDAAMADFDCVLKLDPNNIVALNGKGVLLDTQGLHPEARALFTKANELDPADERTTNNLALSYLSDGQEQQAIRLLSQANQSPLPTLKLNLAFAYLLNQQPDRARKTLLDVMSPRLVESALQDFEKKREAIREGEPVAEVLLAASRQWLVLQEESTDAD